MGQFDQYRQQLTDTAYATFGQAALWAGAPVMVRPSEPDEVVDFGARHTRAVVTTAVLKVRTSEIPAPAENDVVQVFADDARTVLLATYRIVAEPQNKDPFRREWTCEAQAIPNPG